MSSAPTPLRIIGLRVSNYKRVVAIDLRPDGRSVVIGGRNAQGKSSLLDAIADAMGGAKRGSKTELALRTGSVKGEVRVDLGEIVVTRTWTPSSDKLVVESPLGSTLKSPQAVLDKLVGDLSFDPLGFARLESKAQAETLRRLSGLDTRAIDERRAAAFAERTGINGQLKRARTMRDELAVPPEPPAPPAKPGVAGLLEEQERLRSRGLELLSTEGAPRSLETALVELAQEIGECDRALEQVGARIAAAELALTDTDIAVVRLRAAAAVLSDMEPARLASAIVRDTASQIVAITRCIEAQVTVRTAVTGSRANRIRLQELALGEMNEARQEAAAALAERGPIDARLTEIGAALRDADAAGARHAAAMRLLDDHAHAMAEWLRRDAEVARLDSEARRLTGIIDGADEEKLRAIGAARFPIDGLGIDGDVVTYRGVPFSQASQAQRVLVGFSIGAALNPALRVILVREGALLDDESLAALMAAAAESCFQVWVETVGRRDAAESVGVIIEDGRLLAVAEEG